MSQILIAQGVVTAVAAVFAEILGWLAFSHPSSLVDLSYHRYANLIVVVLSAAISAYYLYQRVYPVLHLLSTRGRADLRGQDLTESRRSVLKVPELAAVSTAAIAIGCAAIMAVAHWSYVGSGLRSLKMGTSLGASWCLSALLQYHVLKIHAQSVAQCIAKRAYIEESEPNSSSSIFSRLVVGGVVICAVSGILVILVLHGCLEAGEALPVTHAAARVAAAFLVTQLVTAATLYYLGVSVARPLVHLMKLATRVGSGDLTARFSAVTGDEIEMVGISFNGMVESLRKMTLQLEDVMQEVSTVSASIMEIAEQQTHRGEERAVAVTQITASLENVSKTAQTVAEHCESMAQSAEHALQRAREGQKLVGDTAEGMERIRDTVAAMSRHILSLGEKSKQIGDIIETISGIADETHLLALNAAIESAGAGEHGRRFGVVANEVKRLAQRAVAETVGIKKILTEIQTAANSSVLATEQGIKEVETGSSLAKGAREAIDGVIALVDDTARRTRDISDAMESQKQANLQVVASMREITAASREAATANKQSRASARGLMELGEKLSVIIRLFNTHESSSSTEPDEWEALESPPTEH